MNKFRFGIIGCGKIAHKFIDAVNRMDTCEVAAVASKSMERARSLAEQYGIPSYYDSYETMMREADLDGIYIATVPSFHKENCLLCIQYGKPFLVEKTAFMNKADAEEVFEKAEAAGIYSMEGMWSRFIPTVRKVKQWIDEGAIGTVGQLEIHIGFLAEDDPNSRYLKKDIGGGACYDLTVYAVEIADFLLDGPAEELDVIANWGYTGVSITEQVVMKYKNGAIALCGGSLAFPKDEICVIYGSKGKIVMPKPHVGPHVYRYDAAGALVEEFEDTVCPNGFIYEIQEMIDCTRAGKVESEVTPHSMTLWYEEIVDMIQETDPAKQD